MAHGLVVEIPVSRLRFKDDRPTIPSREVFESVRRLGIVNPLVAAEKDGKIQVYLGNQRLACAKILDIEQVPVIIATTKDDLQMALASYQEVE
jgi:ParB-like chromosome segregation protein Spo0J